MKNRLLLFILVLTSLFLPKMNFGQAPNLGTAADFVLFTSVGAVGNVGISQVTGNVGTNSGSSTGFGNVNGGMHDGDPASAQCAVDVLSAYNDLNGVVPAFFPGILLGNGQILTPGNYEIAAPATLNLGLTLDAQGDPNAVFIIRILGAFAANAASSVQLVNGALACNVYWQVEGMVSLAAGTSMKGTMIVNNAAFDMSAGSTLEGRALSTNGAITIDGVLAFTPIGCGSPVLNGPGSPALGTTACYALFSSDGPVTNAGITLVTGDVGTNLGLTTGYNPLDVNGTIHPIPDGSTLACASDLGILYTYLNTLPTDIELLYPPQFGNGLVLTPHTYLMASAVTFTDTVFLNGLNNPNAVFVINVDGAFSTATFSVVKLINGTKAQNVYWNVDGAVSINDNSTFIGTIIANNGAISINTGVNVIGRALSTTGALLTTAITIAIPSISASAGAITGPSSVCPNATGVAYSVSLIDNATDYVWTLPVGASIATGLNTNSITVDFGNFGGIITVQGGNACGNGTVSADFPVSIDPLPGAAGLITGTSPVCENALGVPFSVGLIANATGYTWVLPLGANIATGLNTNSITVDFGTNGGNITVQGTNACGNGLVSPDFVVILDPLPAAAGLITGTSPICENALGVPFSVGLIANATGYTWVLPLGASIATGLNTNSITVDFGTNGGNITVQGTNACGNGAVSANFVVVIDPLPAAAGLITGTSPVCENALGVPFSVGLIANATGYTWVLPLGASIATGLNTNSITVDFGSNGGNITVQGTNACGNGIVSANFNVIVNPLPGAAGLIAGTSPVCENALGVPFSVALIANATDYIWILPLGASIATGANTNSITVDFGSNGGIINVQGTNACGNGTVSADFNVILDPLPGAPGLISGISPVCENALGVPFSVALIANATGYIWVLPLGATIATGANTNSITVDFGSNGGNINVQGTNACGNGTVSADFNVVLDPLPGAPGLITGTSPICENALGVPFSVALIANATGYIWVLPLGATIATGLNTNSITVDFGTSGGNINVQGTNACGNGTVSADFTVVMNPTPLATASSNSPLCIGDDLLLTASTVVGASYAWTGPNAFASGNQNPIILAATVLDAGNYSLVLTLNGCNSLASVTTVLVNICALDLAVLKTVDNMSPSVGFEVVFTITATNNGPINATGVQVDDLLPGGYTFVSSTVSAGTYTSATGVWSIGNLGTGLSATLSIRAKVNRAGTYLNTATISGTEPDSDPTNNVSSVLPVPTDFFIPEGFSPNGDGINDLFVIRGIENFPNNQFTIFNRWGDKVSDFSSYQNTWNGKSNLGITIGGDDLPTGTYFYILDLGNSKEAYKGTIYLTR